MAVRRQPCRQSRMACYTSGTGCRHHTAALSHMAGHRPWRGCALLPSCCYRPIALPLHGQKHLTHLALPLIRALIHALQHRLGVRGGLGN